MNPDREFPISNRNQRNISIEPWWRRYVRNYSYHAQYYPQYKPQYYDSFSDYSKASDYVHCKCEYCTKDITPAPPSEEPLTSLSRRYGETIHADFMRYGKEVYGSEMFEAIKEGTYVTYHGPRNDVNGPFYQPFGIKSHKRCFDSIQ